ncbi:LamG-like jellyroll fold domain-containing protein [Prosthecobacter dejongeii]|uniref:Ferric-dicitrate binding protein FerR (Iron transport regulator) n=1 Tax=Prosthecobacter dejongeii TaxID=48465 RepID=A0A7W7YGP6_9BACT|nr:LamG-like jellyroll fold domain-containing protein [Prosthecobacter dejongeii]MBB5035890.1 ferric-dicitrate binding protein FerR (iron transport regulator) [Prosthecobacter dejongeii]
MKLDEQIQHYLDGLATAEEVQQLQNILLTQPDSRRLFADLANLDAALAEQAAGWESPVPANSAKSLRTPISHLGLAAAAALALIITGTWWLHSSRAVHATVARGIGSRVFSEGMQIQSADYKMQAGTVEFITARGAKVVIEAPASFRFENDQRLRLERGRVAADVPPSAKGFTVVTPTGQAVDLGTQFGVDVPQHGQAEIHVFKGEVIAQSTKGGKRQSLKDGQAYSLESGAGAAREIRSAAFIQPDEMPALQAALTSGQRARSDAAMAALRRDPALITLLDFENSKLPPGTFRMTQGRWPGSHAPEFVNVGDHMKLNAGADRSWPRLTLAAWVRLDRLEALYQSLYHTDGWDDDKRGQVHWIIKKDATMRLALKRNTLLPGSSEKEGFPDSATPVLPEKGRWVHLAVTYDADAKRIRFYLNGQLDKECLQATAHPALLGPAQIGNWNSQDRKLSGRVDELILLGRTMTDDEIRALFDAGNPYR